MVFIETAVFTRLVVELLNDDEYRELQNLLMLQPDAGSVLRGGGGIRKVRYALPGRGKSGGVRVIYFWRVAADQIHLLLIYPKGKQDTLTAEELATLRKLVKDH